jgi:hypothetical protein
VFYGAKQTLSRTPIVSRLRREMTGFDLELNYDRSWKATSDPKRESRF